jgi:intracellular multiplication protein IcmD
MPQLNNCLIKFIANITVIITLFYSNYLLAGSADQDFGDILYNITGSFTGIVRLVFGISIIAGLCFAVAAIFKFKQHKDNPAQVTIGQPIGLLFLGACMIWLPFIIRTMGATVTGIKDTRLLQQNQSVLEYNKNTEDSGLGKFLIPNQ